jgi:hypothetical protein
MLVTRKSQLTGNTHTMDLNVTETQLNQYFSGLGHVHVIFSHLVPEEREFIMTGITPQEWEQMFGKPE